MERVTRNTLMRQFDWLVAVAKERGINTQEWELRQVAPNHYVVCINRTYMPVSRQWKTKREAYEGLGDMAHGLMLISTK